MFKWVKYFNDVQNIYFKIILSRSSIELSSKLLNLKTTKFH